MIFTKFFLLHMRDEISKTKNSFFFENMYMFTPQEQWQEQSHATRTVNIHIHFSCLPKMPFETLTKQTQKRDSIGKHEKSIVPLNS
ncbi:hypothetical protein RHMOL_Rhmol13G0054500 [Rhododendron molle]|uniref:Uncharacterized protein n=1 Tax=Rhododendron molle TaxID=49168 RepID=A0ACC0L4T6_RHOML|nr:hypothetical protein RHMOL_Rhmol13G0054500 [Rhododendron molle]